MYNLKEATKDFIAKAAFLANDLEYSEGETISEQQVDKWREYTMDIISQHTAAHVEIKRLQALNKTGE